MRLCRCSHVLDGHKQVRGRWLCSITACGCVQPRPADRPWPPPGHRDEYDPSPEPVDRSMS